MAGRGSWYVGTEGGLGPAMFVEEWCTDLPKHGAECTDKRTKPPSTSVMSPPFPLEIYLLY